MNFDKCMQCCKTTKIRIIITEIPLIPLCRPLPHPIPTLWQPLICFLAL